MGLVVDTSAVVAFDRVESTFDRLFDQVGTEAVALPAIVLAELLVGVSFAPDARLRERKRVSVDRLVARVALVDFGAEIAERWADLVTELRRRGQLIPANDAQVAATARHLGYGVLVGERGEAHLGRVEGLRLVRARP